MNTRRKKILYNTKCEQKNCFKRSIRAHSQKLTGRLLQFDEEVEHDAKYNHGDETDRDIYNSESEGLRERVIHRRLLMPVHDRALREEGWNFSHGG